MATFETAYEKVKGLVFAFKESEKTFLSPDYSEIRVRDDFIDELFTALGWDVTHIHEKNPHRQEVKMEKSIADGNKRKRRADYAFSLAPNYKNTIFIVEAKKPARDLLNADDYFQSIRYATNTNTPIVVLTDFEELHVIDARFKTTIDTALLRKIKEYRYQDYADKEKFAEIYYLFSREAVADNSIQEYADSLQIPKSKADLKTYLPKGTKSVDESLLDELEEIRKVLAKAFKKGNPSLDSYALTEATQRTIDRLVFLRFLEDKLLEPDLFVSRYARSKTPWKDFTQDCIRLNEKYNGVVFRKHFIDESSFKSPAAKTFIDVCNRLTNPDYYYDVIPIHILGSIYERFLGKVIHATAKQVTVKEKPEVKKAGGVYYTPQYIVEYIIENTIGKLIEGKSPLQISRMRFADIACGSGSFLISVFGYILDYHSNWYNDNPKKAKEDGCIYIKEDDKWVLSLKQKREILVNNIYGVDIDEQAVEVTELSLYLKLLEDETTATAHEMSSLFTLLPDITNNIICGNSLVEPDILLSDLFSGEEERKLNPMSFDNAFSDFMDKGGFDAIVGNPPYGAKFSKTQKDYLFKKYPNQSYQLDSYLLFLERSLTTVLKENGLFGMIFPNPWLTNLKQDKIRKFIFDNSAVKEIVHFKYAVFPKVTVDTQIVILEKASPRGNKAKAVIVSEKEQLGRSGAKVISHNQKKWRDLKGDVVNIFVTNEEDRIRKKCFDSSSPLSDLYQINVGIKPYQAGKGKPVQTKDTVKDRVFDSTTKKNNLYRQYLRGKDISKYVIAPLEERYIKYGNWLAEPRPAANFDAPVKILMRQTGDSLVGTIDTQQFLCLNNMHVLVPNDTEYSPYFIIGVINSALLNWYYQRLNPEAGEVFAEVKKTNVAKLPVYKIDFSNKTEKAAHDKIIQLVDQIIEAKKNLASATSDRDKNYYERRTSSIDREINKEVYKLYGLSKDEIEIINSD